MKAMSTPTLTTGGDIDSGLNVDFTNFGWKRVPSQLQTSTEDEVSPKPQPQLQRQSWLGMKPPPELQLQPMRSLEEDFGSRLFWYSLPSILELGSGGAIVGDKSRSCRSPARRSAQCNQ
ncbi:hypothetical protein COCNU_13G007390 [Cocos nucifera]|uniref:Uncharacterized protein n=1 Tax=Cocos nucifera TaxID=13894 RepID=A0A8K0ITL5_COCNU|nr:hypothetical protein COCNU_01G021730 [Cocos nucifera]KAG1359358.1 hypothetical protein COCNU_08G008040 [Cocos nucifera]KAG1360928.1 hypothetical protein COCNU_09G003910 [Cocos nucifera]KAG1366949.1 hypothetical protein COCNU_13G007390 [Cocos nucifera]